MYLDRGKQGVARGFPNRPMNPQRVRSRINERADAFEAPLKGNNMEEKR